MLELLLSPVPGAILICALEASPGRGSTGILFLKPFLLQGLSKPDLCFCKGGNSPTIC